MADNTKWVLKKEDVKMWIGFVYLRTGPVASSWEHDNKPSCSAIGRVFHDYPSNYQLFRRGYVPGR
jgi:hypothetical protein